MTVGETIREARIARGMSQSELGRLSKSSKQTIYKYEMGIITNIPLEKFTLICEVLGLDPTSVLGWDEEFGITIPTTDSMSRTQSAATNPAGVIYDRLNEAGQSEYIRYGRYLVSQEEYKAVEPEEPPVEYIRHYFTAAAAGYAAPIEGEDYELRPKDAKTPADADFSISIAGDSMEPYIKDGSTVYVSRNIASLREFDAAIFFVDGDMYCKQFCTDMFGTLYLLSANPKREDANIQILRDSGRSVFCFGRVLGLGKLPMPVYY